MSLLKNKLFVLFITLAFLASGLAFAQTASAITLGELVELFIALGVIAPDKVDAARSIIQEESPLPSSCISLSYNHYLGRSDSETNGEVSKLQNYLKQTGDYSYPEITGYYGPSTQSAVQSWQSRNGVVSSGTPDSTGYGLVGPQTRRVMGCKEVIATQNNSCRGVTIPVRPDFCTQGSEPIYNVQGCQTGWRCSQTDQDINENYNYDTINNTQYPTLPTPFIAVGANPSSINSGQGASLSWNATNAIRCVLRFNSSEEVISVSGAKFVTPNQTTIYTIWCANDPGDGKDGPSASASVSVTVGGSQLATRATYNGYKDGAQFINTQSITRADALANCQLNHKNNPGSSIRCTWGSEQIYNRGSLLPVEIDVEEVEVVFSELAFREQCTGFKFTTNHSEGDVGGEILEMKKFLNPPVKDGTENNFDRITKDYVMAFQRKYSNEILTPVGLSAPNGVWGASSRAKANAINAQCQSNLLWVTHTDKEGRFKFDVPSDWIFEWRQNGGLFWDKNHDRFHLGISSPDEQFPYGSAWAQYYTLVSETYLGGQAGITKKVWKYNGINQYVVNLYWQDQSTLSGYLGISVGSQYYYQSVSELDAIIPRIVSSFILLKSPGASTVDIDLNAIGVRSALSREGNKGSTDTIENLSEGVEVSSNIYLKNTSNDTPFVFEASAFDRVLGRVVDSCRATVTAYTANCIMYNILSHGAYLITGVVDPDNVITELSEENNSNKVETNIGTRSTNGLYLVSPNGGEMFRMGDTMKVCVAGPKFDTIDGVTMELVTDSGQLSDLRPLLNERVTQSQGCRSFTIDSRWPIGDYRLSIFGGGNMYEGNKYVGRYEWKDRSDSTFRIVGGGSSDSITVTAPNGGEQWELGVTNTVTWTPYNPNAGVNHSNNVTAYLEKKNSDGSFTSLGKVEASGKASIHWVTGSLDDKTTNRENEAPVGQYYIRVVNNVTGATDRSDAPFSIIPRPVDLKVNGSDGPIELFNNQKVTVRWSSTGGRTSCQLSGVRETIDGNNYISNLPPSGSRELYVAVIQGWASNGITLYCIDPGVSDLVSVNASIAPASLRIVSPNGGELIDSTKQWRINTYISNIKTFSLALYKNDQWYAWLMKDTSTVGQPNNFEWVHVHTPIVDIFPELKNDSSKIYKIYATGQKSDGTGYIEDKSDAPFGFVNTSTKLLGTYIGYSNGKLFIKTENISEADALANCKLNATNNPYTITLCTWNEKEIFDNAGTTSLSSHIRAEKSLGQPSSAIAYQSAVVPFTKFKLTNNGETNVQIESFVLELLNSVDGSALKSVGIGIEDTEKGAGAESSFGGNNLMTVSAPYVIAPGTSKTFIISATMASDLSAHAGKIIGLYLNKINTSATVSGSLPIRGVVHTISASFASTPSANQQAAVVTAFLELLKSLGVETGI